MATKKSKQLNPKQKLFCQLYAGDREFFGNGVQSYAEAYDLDLTTKGGYATARANSHKLLTKADILNRINETLESEGLNDAFVDKQLKFLITQNADLPTKRASIAEYNKLKARITQKIDHTTDGEKITGINYLRPNGDNKPQTDN